jgi:RNA polymerase sigma factor (sigma-70 family)
MDTHWSLIHLARSGDQEARSRFARQYLVVVRSFLAKRWAGTPAIAWLDDAVQEVFVDLFREDGALTRVDAGRGSRFRSYLFGVTQRVALRHEERHAKSQKRHASDPPPLEGMASDEESLSRVFDREWALQLLRQARARMQSEAEASGDEAAKTRVEILRLRFSEGLPVREIAKRIGEENARVHKQYAKAREEFKACLREEIDIDPYAGPDQVEEECRRLLELLQ